MEHRRCCRAGAEIPTLCPRKGPQEPNVGSSQSLSDAHCSGCCSASCPAHCSPSLENSWFLCKEMRDECSRVRGSVGEAGGRRANRVLSAPLPTPSVVLLLTPVVRCVLTAAQLALRDSCSFFPCGLANTAWPEGGKGSGFAPGGSRTSLGGDCLLQWRRNVPLPCAQFSLLLF